MMTPPERFKALRGVGVFVWEWVVGGILLAVAALLLLLYAAVRRSVRHLWCGRS